MTLKTLAGAAVAAMALAALGGCDRIGSPLQALTSKPPAPDEFQVIARRPLVMPATVSLPEPRPGARSPLEPDPNRDAVVALLGTDTRAAGAGASAGEQALLSAANATSSDPTIRAALASDSAGDANAPYEPPTIWELFGGGGSEKPADALDAAAEARRLQSQGIAAAPVDPDARPEGEAAEAAAVAEDPNLYPQVGVGGPSRNKLPSSGPVPAF